MRTRTSAASECAHILHQVRPLHCEFQQHLSLRYLNIWKNQPQESKESVGCHRMDAISGISRKCECIISREGINWEERGRHFGPVWREPGKRT